MFVEDKVKMVIDVCINGMNTVTLNLESLIFLVIQFVLKF